RPSPGCSRARRSVDSPATFWARPSSSRRSASCSSSPPRAPPSPGGAHSSTIEPIDPPEGVTMSDVAWTGTPVRAHEGARDNGSESLPWGGRRERLPLKWPFAEAVDGFRRKALANSDYDPASTFVWGQMMAVGLIEALKAVEERFGAEGHDVVRQALSRVGDRIVEEMREDVEAPADATPAEVTSLIAS